MIWNQPVALSLPADTTPFQRAVALLGHYDTRFYFSDAGYVDVGAGSLPIINQVQANIGYAGKLGEIGRFCEVNPSARILAGGEHKNDAPVNITFSGLPVMGAYDALLEDRPFKIGNGVVISTGAIILNGRSVGDGTVIGAGAVVSRDCEARGIYAGSPATLRKTRPEFAPWWDWDVAYILANKERLQDLASDPDAPHPYRTARPRFCLKLEGRALSFLGIESGEGVAPLAEAPASVQEYVTQALKSEKPCWLADCWA